MCLVLPAYDEAGRVGDVIRRLPANVASLPTRCLVVDDGSTDGTAEEARLAGAAVVRLDRNCGLGAAVRVGLRAAVDGGAPIVAFCDADGEYAPEELPGWPLRHRRHRRLCRGQPLHRCHRSDGITSPLGNVALTAVFRWIARQPITDGQSGYRVLGRRAGAEASIIHDYNYAQVLTIDLVAKGFVYAEVPISYRFRTGGRSFVRLPTYLHQVVPAVARQLVASRQSATTWSAKAAHAARQATRSTRASVPRQAATAWPMARA